MTTGEAKAEVPPRKEFFTSVRLLRIAAVMALLALALMSWGLFDPRALPIIVSLSVGQGVGTVSFLIYLFVVFRDLRRKLRKPDHE